MPGESHVLVISLGGSVSNDPPGGSSSGDSSGVSHILLFHEEVFLRGRVVCTLLGVVPPCDLASPSSWY